MVCPALALGQETSAHLPASVRAEASERFRRGAELFEEESYRAALVELQRAYELAPDYRVLYNIGQAQLAVHDYLGATKSFEQYLEQGGAAVPDARRRQVEQELASLRKRVGRIGVRVNMPGAEVFIDEERIGVAPLAGPVLANVGRHRVSARSADGATDARMIDVAGGEVAEVSLTLVTAAPRTIVVREQEEQPWSTQNKIALTALSAGGALLIGGTVTGIMALGAQRDLDDRLETGNVNQPSVEDERDRVRRLAIATDALLITGAVSVAAGTVLWLLDRPREKRSKPSESKAVSRLRWSVGPTSLRLRTEF